MPQRLNISRIRILSGRQADGAAYELASASRGELRTVMPSVRTAPRVFMGRDTKADNELSGPSKRKPAFKN